MNAPRNESTDGPIDFASFVSTQPYVPRNLIVDVVTPAKGLTDEENRMLKYIFEMHVRRLAGLYTGISHEPASGMLRRECLIEQNPVFHFGDLVGRPVMKLLMQWMRKSIIPHTDGGLTLSIYEPDPTFKLITAAWDIEWIIPRYIRQEHLRDFSGGQGASFIEMPINAVVTERSYLEGQSLPKHLLK